MLRVRYSKLYIPLAFGEVSATHLGLPLCFKPDFTFLLFCKFAKQDMSHSSNAQPSAANGHGVT